MGIPIIKANEAAVIDVKRLSLIAYKVSFEVKALNKVSGLLQIIMEAKIRVNIIVNAIGTTCNIFNHLLEACEFPQRGRISLPHLHL